MPTSSVDAAPPVLKDLVSTVIAEGDYVVGRWEGGGTHTGPAFADFLIGSLPAASGRKMHFTGTTVLRAAKSLRKSAWTTGHGASAAGYLESGLTGAWPGRPPSPRLGPAYQHR